MKVSINKNYTIRNEKNCSYVIYSGSLIHAKAVPGPLVMTIPSFLGFLLSQFQGDEYKESVAKTAQLLGVTPDKILCITDKLVENNSPYISMLGEQTIYLPKDMLVKSDHVTKVYTTDNATPGDEYVPHRIGVPAYMSIMITSKCHTNCIYCYADRSRPDDMNTETILKLIDEAHQIGVVTALVSGGDIFSNHDWRLILKCLSDYDYHPVLSTKVPLTEDDVAFLISIGVNEIQFSIDTLTPEVATRQLRVMGPTYIKRMEQTLDACERLGLPFNVKSVITKWNGNLDNFRYMYAFFSKMQQIRSWNVVPAFCSNFREDYATYQPSQGSLLAIKAYLEGLHTRFILYTSKLEEKTEPQKKYQTAEEYARRNKICAANTYSMGILSNGKATVCEMLYYNPRFYIGDIQEQSLSSIWNSKKALDLFNFNQQVENMESACHTCKVMEKCKKGMKKRFCLADVINSYGEDKWDYPDPRCPEAPQCDIEKIM